MPKMIDLEREFFKVAKDLATKGETRVHFMIKINKLAEEWIDDKLRLGIAGLENETIGKNL